MMVNIFSMSIMTTAVIQMLTLWMASSFMHPTSPLLSKCSTMNRFAPFTRCLSYMSSSDALTEEAVRGKFKFEGYDKPIVLIGMSSSVEGNELQRLALTLSGALVGNQSHRLQSILEKLERSQGAGLLSERDENEENKSNQRQSVIGISLSAVGMDEEGPFVLDYSLIRDVLRENILSLTSGVLVLDFNHESFHSTASYNADEFETDLIRALSSLAKELYEDEGLLSVYVNVQEGGESDTFKKAKEKKEFLEKDVFIQFSDYELCIKNEGRQSGSLSASWNDIEWELQRIIARALLPSPTVGATGSNSADGTMGLNTFFLSLSFPEVEDASPYVELMCQDVDAMEYRVDLLSSAKDYLAKFASEGGNDREKSDKIDPRFDILYQQQRLRALCRPFAKRSPALPFSGASIIDDAIPIVYTVRTVNQAGKWPDDENGIKQMFELLELGLRSAVEVLDVESVWDASLIDRLLSLAQQRYTSLILGSHHVVGSEVTMDEAIRLFQQCRLNNRAHGGKLVLSINDNNDKKDEMVYKASLAASKLDDPKIPYVGLILGDVGSYSRVLNPRFTPVTHECLPIKAAPGQLTAAEIMASRLITGQIVSERYAILGHNIAYSVSPQMHGSAFAAVKLPHTYTRADLSTVEEFIEGPLWNDDNFGGCSVTIPHKQNIIPHVDLLTNSAEEIGSVNTVLVKKDKFGTRVLIGDNTDWIGIYNPLRRRLENDSTLVRRKSKDPVKKVALILGGGGTARAAAYSAAKLGLERIFFNRTTEKAVELSQKFGGVVAKNLENDNSVDSLGTILKQYNGHIVAVISTLPAAAEFKLPTWLLKNRSLPVVFDVNYKPYSTALIMQAEENGCVVVRGSEMLLEQGVGQFELWTGRTAPYGVMKQAVLENCLPPTL